MPRKLQTYLNQSLQRRLIAVSALLLSLASVAFLIILLVLHTRMLLDENQRASLALNDSLRVALENAMLKRDLNGLTRIVDSLGRQDGIDAVMIVTPTGEIRFSDRHERIGDRITGPAIAQALTSQTAIGLYLTGQEGAKVLRSINPVKNRAPCAECHGDPATHPVNGLLIVDFRATPVLAHALKGTAILIGMGAIVMGLLGLGLWKTTRRLVLDRLAPLAGAFQEIARGRVSTRVPVDGQDEIAAFATGFNAMAERLEAADEALRAARDALEAIIAAAPDGIRVIGPDFRVLHVNDAHLAQLGMTRPEVEGRPCHRLTHGAADPCPATLQTCPVDRILQHGSGPLRFLDRHRTADGTFLNVEVSAAPIRLPVDGRTVDCVIEVIRDLDREMEISHKERLTEIALLANGVAHEINTPLSSILLALDTIRDALPAGDEAQEFADLIESEIQSCMDVTESLMRLSLPSSSAAEAVDLTEVARNTLRLVRPNLEQAGIAATVTAPGPVVVAAPDSDMRILLLNLVVNAIHAMPGGGTLSVEIDRKGAVSRIRVTDTGVGIPPEHLKDIFLPFWTRRSDGTAGRGLGLAICQQVVERLHGRIRVDSTPGKGTRFTIDLPDQDAEEPAEAPHDR